MWLILILCQCPRLYGVRLYVTGDVKCPLFLLHLICLTVLMEKKTRPIVKTGMGLENMEHHADTRGEDSQR